MILGTTGRLAIFASLTLLSAPARADVMEIGENGARWIAGQQAGMPAGDLSMTPAQLAALDGAAVLEDVPTHVTSDPRLTARAVPDTYKAKVAELAARFDLSPSLIEALVWQESRWRTNAVLPS